MAVRTPKKNARLRGLIEVIGTAIDQTTEFSYEFGVRHYPTHLDLFKSDYAVRDIMRKLHEKDAEIERLKVAAGEAKPEESQPDEDPTKQSDIYNWLSSSKPSILIIEAAVGSHRRQWRQREDTIIHPNTNEHRDHG